MIEKAPFPIKKLTFWFLVLCAALVILYLATLAILTIWVGIAHITQPGAWVPIVSGTAALSCAFFLCYALLRSSARKIRQKQSIRL